MDYFTNHSNNAFEKIKQGILISTVFLTPLFFLTTTQEFFVTNKFYLLLVAALLLIATSLVEFLVTKKVVWVKKPLDNAVLLFMFATGLSTLFASQNKVQALLNNTYSVTLIFSLTVLYFYLSRHASKMTVKLSLFAMELSALVLSAVSLFFFFQPFAKANLPADFAFLNNPYFTPTGNPLDLMIFLGVIVALAGSHLLLSKKRENFSSSERVFQMVVAIGSVVGLGFMAVTVFKPFTAAFLNAQQPAILLPPFKLSWYGAVEILKSPVTAFFGFGVDNYSVLFTRVKDALYNTTPAWQVASFNISSSTILHVASEAGLLGVLSFAIVLLATLKKSVGNIKNVKDVLHIPSYSVAFLALFLIAILLPPSLIVFFLLFVFVAITYATEPAKEEPAVVDTRKLLPLYGVVAFVGVAFLAIAGFGVYRSYLAEAQFKKSLDGYVAKSAKAFYDNQREAVITNPFIERFRINFAQANLLIANNIASKAVPQKEGEKAPDLSETDRQTIAQAIQSAISEAKAAVSLNPSKSANWENLANIYRNVLNVAQGADVWTVTAYLRAISFDQQNPTYRLNLGGVYFALKNYDEATKMFEAAAALKPDWPNAHYNLAWATYQKQDYQRAATEMQNALYLLDPKKDAADYKQVQSDLEEIKKKIPAADANTENAPAADTKTQKLTPPSTQSATISPKIKLPKEAQPPATENAPVATVTPAVSPKVTPVPTK